MVIVNAVRRSVIGAVAKTISVAQPFVANFSVSWRIAINRLRYANAHDD